MFNKLNLLLVALICGCSNQSEKAEKQETNYHLINTYSVTDSNKILIKTEVFDLAQNLIQVLNYYDSSFQSQLFTYNSDNQIKEKHVVSDNIAYTEFYDYKMNSNGRVKKKVVLHYPTDTLEIIEYTYNRKGLIIEEKIANRRFCESFSEQKNYEYNENDKVIKITFGRIVDDNDLKKYRTIKKNYKVSNGAETIMTVDSISIPRSEHVSRTKETILRNSHGNEIQRTIQSQEGTILKKYTKEYQFYSRRVNA